jgi:omega-6 fatty acid desaturase (delta-12 desaturase)
MSETDKTQEFSKDRGPRTASSIWQLANTVLPFAGLLVLMYFSLSVSYWITLALGILAGGFMVRVFIIQHDCGHGSFFKSREANNRTGRLCSLVTMIPYYYWRRQHALHHSTSGNLDRRGFGDVSTHTVVEYQRMTKFERFKYRAYRNPFVFLGLGPLALYLITNRFAFDKVQTSKRERHNVYVTNLTVAVMFALLGWWLGFGKLFLIAVPVMYVAAAAGIWLFYIQHQFDPSYWKRQPEWDYTASATEGSSFFKLPKVLQWFTGNIGYHHVHHLQERIPNYRLQQVYDETPELHDVHTLTLGSSLKTMFLGLWDEEHERLISFREFARAARSA